MSKGNEVGLGGDPIFQAKDFLKLIKQIKRISEDIIIYTVYMKNEVPKEILENIAVLIDAPYVQGKNNNCLLRDSKNQTIYILNKKCHSNYEKYLSSSENQIQNFTTNDGYISVGIHQRDFKF